MKATTLVIIVLAVSVGILGWQLQAARSDAQDARLARDSAQAATDTSRAMLGRVATVLGAELAARQRRAIQQTQRSDSLDRALGLERRVRIRAELRIKDLELQLTGIVEADPEDNVRRSSFQVDQAPFTGTVDVELPRPPAMGTLGLRLGITPAPIEVRVGCGPEVDGIRPAQVTLVTPSWLTATIGTPEQDPAVCQAPKGMPPPKRGPVTLERIILVGLAAIVILR